jgi:hypothetical protein
MADGDWINIPLIAGDPEGAGNVGRFIDSLSPKCRFPCVVSPRLEGMLLRRGWWAQELPIGDGWDSITCFYHPAAVSK